MHTKHTTHTRRALAAMALCAIVLASAPAGGIGAEVLANSDIIALSRSGMTPQVIIAKIAASSNIFDVSARGLLSLKENGVADEVIAGMLTAGAAGSAGVAGIAGLAGITGTGAALPAALSPVLSAAMADPARLRRELGNLASPGEESRAAAMAWLLANRQSALPELRRALTDRDPAISSAATRALGDLRDAESLHAIRNLIASPDPAVRRAAAQALHVLGDSQSVNAAEQALTRPVSPLDGYIRLVGHARLTRAAAALGQILSANPESLNRAAAAWSLGEIGRAATPGRPALEKAIETDADAAVRRECAIAIAKFHDPESAQVLMNACRRDPEVRSMALEGLAEYPESVEFLVGVMNLGADQIAVNELETARASLYRLTGQDFGLDGGRWTGWFAANRGAFSGLAGGTPAGTPAGYSPYSPYSAAGLPPPAVPARNVDVEAWSLVADAADIPMAPQVDAGQPALTNFAARPAVSSPRRPASPPGAVDSSSIPMALSPSDFDAGAGFALPGLTPPSTQSIPAMDIAQGALTGAPTLPIPPMEAQQSVLEEAGRAVAASIPAGEPPAGLFRTWSSDPERGAPEPRAEDDAPSRVFSGFPGRTDGAAAAGTETPLDATDTAATAEPNGQWRRVPAEELSSGLSTEAGAGDPFASALPDTAADPFAAPADPFAAPDSAAASSASSATSAFTAPATPALLPSGPIVTPLSASVTEDADDDPLRGFSLSLPGMSSPAPAPEPSFDSEPSFASEPSFSSEPSFADPFAAELSPADAGVSFMPEDGTLPVYDPAAVPGETVLLGDELGNIVDFAGTEGAVAGDWQDAGASPFVQQDPFAQPDPSAAPAIAPGESVVYAPSPDGTDVFSELPALESIAQGVDNFTQGVDGMVQDAAQSIARSVDGAAQTIEGSLGGLADSALQTVDSSLPGSALQTADSSLPGSALFVEPSPGQVMVDDSWTGGDAWPGTASAPQIDFPGPQVAGDSVSVGGDSVLVTGDAVSVGGDSAPAEATPYMNPYEHNPPPPNPAYITTDPNFAPPIRDYTEPYSPPAAPAPAAADGGAPAAAPARAGSGGAKAAPVSDEMPRMLGEGFFGK